MAHHPVPVYRPESSKMPSIQVLSSSMNLKPPSMPITSRGQAFVRDASTLLLPRTKPPDAPPRPRSSFVCFVDFVVKSPGRLPPHQTQKLSKMPGIRVNPTTSELLFCSLHPGRRGGTNSASSTLLDRGSHPFLGTAGYIQHPARLPQNPHKNASRIRDK